MSSKDPRQNQYWKMVVKQIEQNAREETNCKRIKYHAFYPSLPRKLLQRVSKIIPLDYSYKMINSKHQTMYQTEIQKISERSNSHSKNLDFNESTCSLIQWREEEFPKFTLNLKNVGLRKVKHKKERHNWQSTFICAPRKQRVKWDSKIYHTKKHFDQETLEGKAKAIIDAAAERFSEWMNNLGSKTGKPMTKEDLKSFFNNESNRTLLSSIEKNPNAVKAIARSVADKWNMPEISIELKYEDYLKSLMKKAPKKIKTVAFGKTIPYKKRKWVQNEEVLSMATCFPEEILSGENIFKGIHNLKTFRAFIKHCQENPNVSRPKYLVENGYFKVPVKKIAGPKLSFYELLTVN